MQLVVKNLAGQAQSYNVLSSDTVLGVKVIVQVRRLSSQQIETGEDGAGKPGVRETLD
jgi:hypothetical protein